MPDLPWLLISGLYVLGVIVLAEWLRRSDRLSFSHSRKLVHVGVGTWIVPTVRLFESPYWAAAGPAAFILFNLLSRRRQWLRAVDSEAGDNLGSVLFPIAFVVLILVGWNVERGKEALTAGILCLAWGDAAAALIGRPWGRHRYRVGSEQRSLEGSAAMLLVSAVAVAATGPLLGRPGFGGVEIALAAVVATLLEAVSRRGFDNLWVPLGTAALLSGFHRFTATAALLD